MLFGSPFGAPVGLPLSPVSPIVGLFDTYPIGTRLGIGMDASFWVGNFGGIQDGVALLTNAQLFANMGKPIDGLRPVVRIPIQQITFVSQ
ncbi:hypothetical protein [Desulfitobacterium metallireducens]|uniref:Uncharacterized protein n=1 Tax=Desulfitobacterium metallireducens DSM 15288 TaxID=871968 RepID=W0E6L0_9FIRM|nr:hypothetical protein [Desulfitobacterium metallireducens]AHF06530.1 hypothetical protein DESME_05240 [Desulfitobacterium metallireducens DSM 15288]